MKLAFLKLVIWGSSWGQGLPISLVNVCARVYDRAHDILWFRYAAVVHSDANSAYEGIPISRCCFIAYRRNAYSLCFSLYVLFPIAYFQMLVHSLSPISYRRNASGRVEITRRFDEVGCRISAGGKIRLETLSELKFLNSRLFSCFFY